MNRSCLFPFDIVFVLMLSSVIFGITITFPALTTEAITKEFDLNTIEITLFSSLAALLAIIGPFVFQPLMNSKGRRQTIRLLSLSCFVSYFLFSLSTKNSKYLIFSHRCTIGVIIGGISSVVPVYLVEIASAKQKKTFGSLSQLGTSIGVVLGNLFGGVFNWRAIAVICCVASLFIFIYSFFIPESPVFLKKVEKGVLSGGSNKSSMSVFSGNFTSELFDGFLFMFIQQFSGINGLLTNAGALLGGSASAATIGASAQCISCVFCSSVISKLGERKTWIISCSGAFVSLLLLSLSEFMNEKNGLILVAVAVFIFQLSFGFGLGPIPWIMTPLLFPDDVRSTASSLLTSVNWLLAFIVISIFPSMRSHFGMSTTGFIFSAVMVVGIVFGLKMNINRERLDENGGNCDAMSGVEKERPSIEADVNFSSSEEDI